MEQIFIVVMCQPSIAFWKDIFYAWIKLCPLREHKREHVSEDVTFHMFLDKVCKVKIK
jgi:hypothetical protein